MVGFQNLAELLSFKRTLYFSHTAGDVFLRGKNIVHRNKETGIEEVFEMSRIRRIVLIGKPAVSSTLLYRFMRAGIDVDWLDIFGRPLENLFSLENYYEPMYTRQEVFIGTEKAFELARHLLLAKIDNSYEVLRRRCSLPSQWQVCRRKILKAVTSDQLRGAEGMAAHLYFDQWKQMVAPFEWRGRKAYPAIDPVNALLSLGYCILHNRFVSALRHEKLNPRTGFFHVGRGHHCALASDLMEPLRPQIDAVILRLIRRRQLSPSNFELSNSRCRIAGHDIFSLVLQNFEAMFNHSVTMYYYIVDQWTSHTATINDHIDEIAYTYRQSLCDDLKVCVAPRLRQCKII